MDEDIRWPKKGDNPFLVTDDDPFSSTWASLSWFSSMKVDDSYVGTAFKEAGDMIVKQLAQGKGFPRADKFFLPIAFLYRHSLELNMKKIIRLGMGLKLIGRTQKVSKDLRNHNLHQLWNSVRRVIQAYEADAPPDEMNFAAGTVLAFHNIDKTGQGLRYTKDRSGNSNLEQFPEAVQLTHLQDVFERAFNFLDDCESVLDHAFQESCERLS